MNALEMLERWFSYDPTTGIVAWKAKPNRNIPIGRAAGFKWGDGRNTYIRIVVEGQWVFAHTIAFAAIHGRLPDGVIAHADQDGTNNRENNISDVTHAVNLRNQRINSRNSSGVMGVDYHKGAGKWRARIVVDRMEHHLGVFDTNQQAIDARKAAEMRFGFHQNHGRT